MIEKDSPESFVTTTAIIPTSALVKGEVVRGFSTETYRIHCECHQARYERIAELENEHQSAIGETYSVEK
ncbi:hypothetical protein ACFQE1_03190 [Halobium palmae]|uniref:Uncharacterized protein n=1 Tax=Halobium palmae TaxID=1776492 RepID=A0ABD5RVI2_9EURY